MTTIRLSLNTLSALLLSAVLAATAWAQDDDEKEKKPPEPEVKSFYTKDNVVIVGTYYASLLEEKATPVILLHGWEGQRTDLDGVALKLQAAGHAVLTLDLRGHGDSVRQRNPINDSERTLDLKRFNKNDVLRMVLDLEAAKKFLMAENNARRLNIDALSVVGIQFSCIVAANWAVQDWSWPQLPGRRQGQDVKGLVFVSPEVGFKGISIIPALRRPAVARMSTMIMVGAKDSSARRDADRIFKLLEPVHPKVAPEERLAKQDLFLISGDTSLQGVKYLNAAGVPGTSAIARFLELRMVNKQAENFPWQQRE